MLGYITLGTNNLAQAAEYYDELLKEFGATRQIEFANRLISWGTGTSPMIGLIKPFDGQPATVGNGTMPALAAKDRAQVETVYKKALELGGTDEGAPGDRGGGFYAAYFRDPEGHKFVVYHIGG